MELKGILLWAGLLVICGVFFFFTRRIKKEIEEKGILAEGIISRIEEDSDPDSVSYKFYVKFQTREGEEIEGLLLNPRYDLEVGERVLIKYHPKLHLNCRLVTE